MKLTKIFEPITINKTKFKNRMVVSAMVTNYCNEDGTPTEKFMAYHEHKAKGGYGIIITEDFAVTRTAGAFGHYVKDPVWDEETIIYAELDMDLPASSKMEHDAVGHYARPDVLQLVVFER